MMQTRSNTIVACFLQLCAIYVILLTCTNASGQHRQEYIVYMGDFKHTLGIPPPIVHSRFLKNALGVNSSATIIYSYKNNFNCFLALLKNEEVQQISSMKGVLSVFPNRNNDMLTTRSWDFINFPQKIQRKEKVESNIIVGVIDSGIWPESKSFRYSRFSFSSFSRPPKKWKGSCKGLTNFTCNNSKIIGARYYKKNNQFSREDVRSPRDTNGHGTYMASIIAGNIDNSASFFGLGTGTTRGGVPSSRIAVYKVCWSSGCDDADVLAAFADAITDGVDIISISLGDESPLSYFTNSLSIGSFKAMRKGILTVAPTGNKGPNPSSLLNVFPWVVSVGASTIDRNFISNLEMGNGVVVKGASINMFDPIGFSPIVYGSEVPNRIMNVSSNVSRMCERNTLDKALVKNKIVICDKYNIGTEALSVGAVGMVIRANGRKDDSQAFVLPTTYVTGDENLKMQNYVMSRNRHMNPTARIFKSNRGLDSFLPYIGSFSSRGPNLLTPEILKPDLCAPGVHILAAWTHVNSPTNEEMDRRRSSYNILSGTSTASAHVAAAAAYVKSFHPSLSPAAIKSALMTTASKMSETLTPNAEFAYGAGNINLVNAINPGLVYDANMIDYVQFLCGHDNYTNEQLHLLTSEHTSCTSYGSRTPWYLNMPSFSIPVSRSTRFNITLTRKVTNVGSLSFVYNAVILSPSPSVRIRVVPTRLSFSSVGQTFQFQMFVEGIITREKMVSASLSWISPKNTVRSPIVVFVREQP